MIELLSRHDPAARANVDPDALFIKVEEKLAGETSVTTPPPAVRRRALVLVAAFAAVTLLFLPLLLIDDPGSSEEAFSESFGELPGVEAVIADTPGRGGGVRTMAVEGDTIWLTSALSRQLVQIDTPSNTVTASYPIDAYVEGVAVGGGYLWLRSYDGEGEILRFDPTGGAVDLTLPIAGITGVLAWWDDHLLVSTDDGRISQVTADGEVSEFGPGKVVAAEADRIWVQVPGDTADTFTLVSSDGDAVPFTRDVLYGLEADGSLWVVAADRGLYRLDIGDGSEQQIGVGRFPHGLAVADGWLWVSDHHEHTLSRVDTTSGESTVTPLAGRPGAMVAADGSLFVSLYQPGLLLRVDPTAELETVDDVIVDDVVDGYRLFCTGGGEGPTVLLDGEDWLDPGAWSVVQDRLSEHATVCAHGNGEESDFSEDNANLLTALAAHGIDGPYLLVANGEGVISTRFLASELNGVVGVVLVDPLAPGFREWFELNLPDRVPESVPPTPDMSHLPDFGDVPLVLIGHDLDLTFSSPGAAEALGSAANAEALDRLWRDGQDFYLGLSTDSKMVTAEDSFAGFQVVWQRPDLVVDVVTDALQRAGG